MSSGVMTDTMPRMGLQSINSQLIADKLRSGVRPARLLKELNIKDTTILTRVGLRPSDLIKLLICPDCGGDLRFDGHCRICQLCEWSACS